jgi:uncharacterized RDD family membrane protein YckC
VSQDVPPIPRGDQLAATGRRALAAVLDLLVVGAPMIFLLIGLAATDANLSNGELLVASAVSATISGLYHTMCVRFWGKTVGKSACGCVVVRANDGGPVDTWAASIRALVPLVAGAVPVVGPFVTIAVYVMAFVDPRRQGLHDKAAATIVVQR